MWQKEFTWIWVRCKLEGNLAGIVPDPTKRIWTITLQLSNVGTNTEMDANLITSDRSPRKQWRLELSTNTLDNENSIMCSSILYCFHNVNKTHLDAKIILGVAINAYNQPCTFRVMVSGVVFVFWGPPRLYNVFGLKRSCLRVFINLLFKRMIIRTKNKDEITGKSVYSADDSNRSRDHVSQPSWKLFCNFHA